MEIQFDAVSGQILKKGREAIEGLEDIATLLNREDVSSPIVTEGLAKAREAHCLLRGWLEYQDRADD